MKISMIIPCYNAQKYLAACLDSLLAQSVEDYEAILIDDGSNDHTAEIAAAYASIDPRFKLVTQENAGVSVARNAGLSLARGEWILFVDADDLLPPDALERLLLAAREDTEIVVSLHETFGEGCAPRIEYPQTQWMKLKGEEKRHAAALRLIEGDAVLNVMCNKLHKRAFLEREHIVLTPGIRIAEDALFNLEAVLCAHDVAFCESVTYRYRIHPESATQRKTGSEFEKHLPWFGAMAGMLERRGVLERYYPAYHASIVLRLYKDGGVTGVMRRYKALAKPILLMKVDEKKLGLTARTLRYLCRRNLYPAVYPLVFPFEVIGRKISEFAFMLRMRGSGRG